jgi:hypothetical protein
MTSVTRSHSVCDKAGNKIKVMLKLFSNAQNWEEPTQRGLWHVCWASWTAYDCHLQSVPRVCVNFNPFFFEKMTRDDNDYDYSWYVMIIKDGHFNISSLDSMTGLWTLALVIVGWRSLCRPWRCLAIFCEISWASQRFPELGLPGPWRALNGHRACSVLTSVQKMCKGKHCTCMYLLYLAILAILMISKAYPTWWLCLDCRGWLPSGGSCKGWLFPRFNAVLAAAHCAILSFDTFHTPWPIKQLLSYRNKDVYT